MLKIRFPIALDRDVASMAVVLIFVGAIIVGIIGWITVGWAILSYGLVILWFSHEIAIASTRDEGYYHSDRISMPESHTQHEQLSK